MQRKKVANTRVQFDEKDREEIKRLASIGMSVKEIGWIKGYCERTLLKYCTDDMAKGRADAHQRICQRAYDKAMTDESPTMLIFYLKTQRRWREKDWDDEENGNSNKPLKLGTNDPIEAAKIYTKIMGEGIAK